MNFFKSILSDDPDPPNTDNPQRSSPTSTTSHNDIDPKPDSSSSESESADTGAVGVGGAWNFGGLIKTLATRSESVIDTYRRDLQEFGTGLKKETVIFREVASRAVKELPASIEVGASVAHGALDGVIKSTAEIISHGKETLLSASSDVDPDTPSGLVSDSGKYSRFEARLNAIQNDLNTFCEEPEDLEEYEKWKSGFVLGDKREEVENLIGENGVLEGVYKRVVPDMVDDGTFWYRYFYRVSKLMQQESVRASLVKRAISIDEEEELSWDVDDDEYEEDEEESDEDSEHNVKNHEDSESEKKQHSSPTPPAVVVEKEPSCCSNESQEEISDKSLQHELPKEAVVEAASESIKLTGSGDESRNLESEKQVENVDGAVEVNENEVKSKEGKGGDDVVATTSPSKVAADDASSVSRKQDDVRKEKDEEEMGWDEIEDMGSDDDKKESSTTTPSSGKVNSDDVRRRLSTAEEDEDLSWDIEDDA